MRNLDHLNYILLRRCCWDFTHPTNFSGSGCFQLCAYCGLDLSTHCGYNCGRLGYNRGRLYRWSHSFIWQLIDDTKEEIDRSFLVSQHEKEWSIENEGFRIRDLIAHS